MARFTVDGVESGAQRFDAANAAVVAADLAQEVDAFPRGQNLTRLVHRQKTGDLRVPAGFTEYGVGRLWTLELVNSC